MINNALVQKYKHKTYFFHSDKSQDKTKPLAEWFPNSKDKQEKFIKEKLNTRASSKMPKDENRNVLPIKSK